MKNRFIILSKELYDREELTTITQTISKISEPKPDSEDSIIEGGLFILWLFTQTKRNDNLGRVARLVREDILEKKHFPDRPSKYQIMLHLVSHNLNGEGRAAFSSAWDEFQILKPKFIKNEIDKL